MRDNINEYIKIFKYLLKIIDQCIINGPLLYKVNAISRLFDSSTNKFIINDNNIESLSSEYHAFFWRSAFDYKFNHNIINRINNFIDTVINNINNLQQLSTQEIKERVNTDYQNICSKIESNDLLRNDIYYNTMNIVYCYNKINEYYNKFIQSKFELSNNQDKKTIASLLLAKCFEEGSNLTKSIINNMRFLRDLKINLIKFTDDAEKHQFLQVVNNIKLEFNKIVNINNLFVDLTEPITKQQSAIAQKNFIEYIKTTPINIKLDKYELKKLLDFPTDTQKVTFSVLLQHVIEKFNFLNKYYSELNLQDPSVLIDLKNSFESIKNNLNALGFIITRIEKSSKIPGTKNYSPIILGNIASIINKINYAINYLVKFTNGNQPNPHPGLVPDEEWYAYRVSEILEQIRGALKNISNDCQEILYKINK